MAIQRYLASIGSEADLESAMSEISQDGLVDIKALCAWMDAQGLGTGLLENVRQLGGGSQNLLFRFDRSNRSYVLRRPPRYTVADGNKTMLKEARFLVALAGTDVPHPALIAKCDDISILGTAFYLMEPVVGFNATVGLPPMHAGDAQLRRRMGFALVDGLTQLGEVNHRAVGLGDLEREDFLARQVARWNGQLEGYGRYSRWQGRADLTGLDYIARWLEDHRPLMFSPGIMHGDYHLANVMYRTDATELAAIIDWEMATIGDPLLDLAWVLAMWPTEDDPSMEPLVTPWEGFPSAEELIAHYAAETSRDLAHFTWYRVLACYKMAIVLEGTYARASDGKASPEIGERFHRIVIGLIARASRLIERIN